MFQKEDWERRELEKRRHPPHPVIKEYVVPKINEIRKIISINNKTKLLDVGGGKWFLQLLF